MVVYGSKTRKLSTRSAKLSTIAAAVYAARNNPKQAQISKKGGKTTQFDEK
jgi:hypothetical protein